MLDGRIKTIVDKINNKVAYQYVLLAVITLLAAALRFYKLGEWSFWIDELATITRARGHFNIETLLEEWWRPPISVILTGGILKAFGTSEWNARLGSTLIGIISIPIVFFLCKRLFNLWVGFAVAILLTVSPWHIFWSQNARFYTSLMIFYFIASVAFFFYIERAQVRYLLLFGVFFFFALAERYIAILLVPVLISYLLALWLLPFGKPPGLNPKTMALLILPVIALAGLEIYGYLITGTTRLGFTLDTFMGRPIDSPARIAILIIFTLGIPLIIMSLFNSSLVFYTKNRAALFFLVSAVVPVVIILAVSQFAFVVERYAFITLPAWIILVAFGITVIQRQFDAKGIYITLAVLAILIAHAGGENLLYFEINHGNRPEWKKAFEYVTGMLEEGDEVVSSVPGLGTYYMNREVLGLRDVQPEKLVEAGQRVWFVMDSENSWFAPRQKLWVEEHADFLEVYYLRVREAINIKIYLSTADDHEP